MFLRVKNYGKICLKMRSGKKRNELHLKYGTATAKEMELIKNQRNILFSIGNLEIDLVSCSLAKPSIGLQIKTHLFSHKKRSI